MRDPTITIRLPRPLLFHLDDEATKSGLPRSSLVRVAVLRQLALKSTAQDDPESTKETE